jgi:hypothetical protein
MHWRAEPDDVAVEIDECTFALSPLGVLGAVHLSASGSPLGGELIRVVNVQVRGTSRPLMAGRKRSEVELDAVAGRKPVDACIVRACTKPQSLVVLESDADVAYTEYRRHPLEHAVTIVTPTTQRFAMT